MDARDLWALLHHCTKAGMIVMKSLGGLGNTSGNHKYRLKLYHVNMMVKHRHHFWAKAHFKQTEAKWKLFCGQRFPERISSIFLSLLYSHCGQDLLKGGILRFLSILL